MRDFWEKLNVSWNIECKPNFKFMMSKINLNRLSEKSCCSDDAVVLMYINNKSFEI